MLEFSSVEAIKRCCLTGAGVAVVSAISARDDLLAGRLVGLAWTGPGFGVATQLVRHRDKWLSPTLGAFVRITRELCSARGPSPTDPGRA